MLIITCSELNYPIGPKTAIDLSKKGLRWDIPLYLLDALFYATEGRTTIRITLSAESEELLQRIKQKVGYALLDPSSFLFVLRVF